MSNTFSQSGSSAMKTLMKILQVVLDNQQKMLANQQNIQERLQNIEGRIGMTSNNNEAPSSDEEEEEDVRNSSQYFPLEDREQLLALELLLFKKEIRDSVKKYFQNSIAEAKDAHKALGMMFKDEVLTEFRKRKTGDYRVAKLFFDAVPIPTAEAKRFREVVYQRLANREKKKRQRARDLAAEITRPRKKQRKASPPRSPESSLVPPCQIFVPETLLCEIKSEDEGEEDAGDDYNI